jgi:hypothetical protein
LPAGWVVDDPSPWAKTQVAPKINMAIIATTKIIFFEMYVIILLAWL